MANKEQVTVTLTIENWEAIMDLVKLSCHPRGANWINWGQEINQVIQLAIDKSSGERPTKNLNDSVARLRGIVSVEFKRYTNTVEVQFKGGASYEYYRVPYEIYAGLMKAESREEYFYRMIHNTYQRKRVSQEANQKEHQIGADESDFDQSYDEYDAHNPDFGQWIDVGGGESVWDSYVDDD